MQTKLTVALGGAWLLVGTHLAADTATVERRLSQAARFLSSDELGGRGLGTPGIDQAAEYVAQQFAEIGLETDVFAGEPFQRFHVTIGAEMGTASSCRLVHPQRTIDLRLGEDFNPFAIGGDGPFDVPLTFVGYGITAPEADYDDYAGTDVTGRGVIVLRHEPQQNNPHSAFNGTDHSEHAPFRRKISNAFQHGAAAIIFCTGQIEIGRHVAEWETSIAAAEKELATATAQGDGERAAQLQKKLSRYAEYLAAARDPVLDFTTGGAGSDAREIPVLHCRRGVIDELLAECGQPSLATIEDTIDDTLNPQSFSLPGCRAVGNVDIDRTVVEVRNVAAVLPGSGPLAHETVVVGAHYDHLGRGGEGSAEPGSKEIHNGADDNASGVAALLEIGRILKSRPVPFGRRVVFVAFTGEERGLLGSAQYARDPPFPLEDTVAMINLDMVGRLKNNQLIVHGTETGDRLNPWIDRLNERHGFEISKSGGGFGPSDHSTFYAKQIPVLHFFTGSHTDYHRPSDDFHLLNVTGMRRVSDFVAQLIAQIAGTDHRLAYVEVAQQPMGDGRNNPRPYFGSIPDFANSGAGYAITGTGPGSPADEAGLKAGDVIIKLGDFQIGNLEDFDGALRKYAAGDKVPVIVRRGNDQVELHVTLAPPR